MALRLWLTSEDKDETDKNGPFFFTLNIELQQTSQIRHAGLSLGFQATVLAWVRQFRRNRLQRCLLSLEYKGIKCYSLCGAQKYLWKPQEEEITTSLLNKIHQLCAGTVSSFTYQTSINQLHLNSTKFKCPDHLIHYCVCSRWWFLLAVALVIHLLVGQLIQCISRPFGSQ